MIRALILAVALAALSLWLHPAGAQVTTQQISPATTSVGGTQKNGHPGYVASNWYVPISYMATAGAPATPGANKIVCDYGVLGYPVTLNTLGIINATTDSTKRFQLGIYSNGAWGRPSTLLASTADITLTGPTGAYSGVVSAAIPDGGAWFCINTESASAVFVSLATAGNGLMSAIDGSATQANVGNAGSAMVGVSVAQTYGTWPATFTSGQSWTEVTNATTPWVQFKVASSP